MCVNYAHAMLIDNVKFKWFSWNINRNNNEHVEIDKKTLISKCKSRKKNVPIIVLS